MVPAPTSTSSGCCRAQPRDVQNSESLRMRPWNVTLDSTVETRTSKRHEDTKTRRRHSVSLCLCGRSSLCLDHLCVSSAHLSQHAHRLELLLQMHRDQRP